jgi:hypothetical protein
MQKIIVTLLAFVLVTVRAHGEDTPWKEYVNRRFGFSLRYPATLTASPAPENGAGREFHTADKEFSILAEGHFLRVDEGDSLNKSWQDELDSLGDTITYKKKTNTWFVVSGVTKNGTEYYHKFYNKLDSKGKGGNWAGFSITYPHAKNKQYDPWVERIEKSFVPFLKGNFDRIQ